MEKEHTWMMRLTLVNNLTGQTTFAMYPQDKYSLLDSLDLCQLPYGSGEYRHLAESPNGVYSDSLQTDMTGVIESETHPPSIQELNYLGGQIQRMTAEQRAELGRQLTGAPEATVTDAINAAHRLLDQEMVYDGNSMADRAVLLGQDEPYIRVQLFPDDGEPQEGREVGLWIDCPAQDSSLDAAAQILGVSSARDLTIGEWDGLLAVSEVPLNENDSPFVAISDISDLARAMEENGVLQSLSKFKAVLQAECCGDFGEAAELAGKLDQYEFYRQAEFDRRCRIAGLEMDWGEAAKELDMEETGYGLIRPVGEQTMEQELKALRWSELAENPNPLLELAGQLYEQTDGLCQAGAGPGGIGVSNSGGSRIHLFLSFDPPPVQNNTIFPAEIGKYKVQVMGCWDKDGETVRQKELVALLDDPDPTTQKMAEALWELTQETRMVSTEECNEAFDILADWQLRDAYGTPNGAPNVSQKAAEEPERGPTMCQL